MKARTILLCTLYMFSMVYSSEIQPKKSLKSKIGRFILNMFVNAPLNPSTFTERMQIIREIERQKRQKENVDNWSTCVVSQPLKNKGYKK